MKNIIFNLKQVIKLLLLVCMLGISCVQILFAQSTPSQPQPVNQPPNSPGYPFSFSGTPAPVVEGYSYVYYPQYFPYFAYYLYTLADEVQWFYEQAQNDVTGSGPYDESYTLSTNGAIVTGNAAAAAATQAATLADVTSEFTMVGSNISTLQSSGIAINGTDITQNTSVDNSPFVFDSLYAPIGYTSTQQAALAQDAIQFIIGSYLPINVPSLSSNSTTAASQLALPDVQNYFLKLRTYTSEASVAISNLNYILNERTQQQGLGTAAGMTTLPTDASGSSPIANASPLQIEQFMVQRRAGNKTWYTNVNSATATDISRETLFVLAEIETELFQLHLDNERMMAVGSVGVLGLGGAAKMSLSAQAQNIATEIANNGGSP